MYILGENMQYFYPLIYIISELSSIFSVTASVPGASVQDARTYL